MCAGGIDRLESYLQGDIIDDGSVATSDICMADGVAQLLHPEGEPIPNHDEAVSDSPAPDVHQHEVGDAVAGRNGETVSDSPLPDDVQHDEDGEAVAGRNGELSDSPAHVPNPQDTDQDEAEVIEPPPASENIRLRRKMRNTTLEINGNDNVTLGDHPCQAVFAF